AERARQFDEARLRPRAVQRLDDTARFGGRIEPVRIEADQAEAYRRMAERIGQPAAVRIREIEIVHRAGDIEIGVGVETVDETDPLVAQIGFDLEICIEAEG